MAMYSGDGDSGFEYSADTGRAKKKSPPLRSRRKPPAGRKGDSVAAARGIHRRRNKRMSW